MQVREGMSQVVLSVGPGHTLRDAARRMSEKKTGAALVIDDESPAPRIITERDILLSVGERRGSRHRAGRRPHDGERDLRGPGLEPREGGKRDVAPRNSPPGRLRGRRAGRACSRCATSSASGRPRARPPA